MQQCGEYLINTTLQVCCSAKPCSTSCISKSYSSSNTTQGRCQSEFFYDVFSNPSSGVPALIFAFYGPILVSFFLPFIFCKRPFNYLYLIKSTILNTFLILFSVLVSSMYQSVQIIFSEIFCIFIAMGASVRSFALENFGREDGFLQVFGTLNSTFTEMKESLTNHFSSPPSYSIKTNISPEDIPVPYFSWEPSTEKIRISSRKRTVLFLSFELVPDEGLEEAKDTLIAESGYYKSKVFVKTKDFVNDAIVYYPSDSSIKPMHNHWWLFVVDLIIAIFGYQVVLDLFPIFAYDIKFIKIRKYMSTDKDKYRFASIAEATNIGDFIAFDEEFSTLANYTV